MNIDFNELATKETLTQDNSLHMIVFKQVNDKQISFRIPLNIFEKFYLNVTIVGEIKNYINTYRENLKTLVSKIALKSDIENIYLEKKDATYEKSKLLTEEKMKTLLNDYCNEIKIDTDLEAVEASARATATSLGNYFAIIASIEKQTRSENSYTEGVANKFLEKMDELSEGGEESEEEGNSGD